MPNIFVTNTARFNPFTYQELLAPIVQATQMQYAAEEALANIDDGSLDYYLAGEDPDSDVVKRYNNINSRIKDASKKLSTSGISAELISNIQKLKGDYKKYMTPVETMGKKKQQLMDEYRKLSASNPRLIGENPGKYDLQWYIDHPNYNPIYDNGEAYLKEGELFGKQLAAQLRNPNAPYTPIPGTNGAFLRAVFRRGYSQDEIANDPMFDKIVNQVLESRGIDPNDNSPETMQRRAYVREGLFESLGKEEIQERQNPNYMTPLQSLQYRKLKQELDTPPTPEEPVKSTQYGDINYVGKNNSFAQKVLGTSSTSGIVRSLQGQNVTDAHGQAFNNTLEVTEYLKGLEQQVKDAQRGSVGGTANVQNSNWDIKNSFYKKEKERLKDYFISNSDFRKISGIMGSDNFTYDDVINKFSSERSSYGAINIPKYSLASAADSKENFDRYIQNLAENVKKEGNANAFYAIGEDGVSFEKRLNSDYVYNKLKDKKAIRVYTTTPLVFNGSNIRYVAVNFGDNQDVAVPAELFNDLTQPILDLPYRQEFGNTGILDINDSMISSANRNIEKSARERRPDFNLNWEFQDWFDVYNSNLDVAVRNARRVGQGKKEYEFSSGKADY